MFLVQVNWEEEMREGLNWGLGIEEPLPSVPGVTKQHPEIWDAPTKLLGQDRVLERQDLGFGEYLLTPGSTVAFAL